MYGSCAPPPCIPDPCPPPCPPQDPSEPLGDWGGQGALDALNDEYAQQSTNASGLDDTESSVPGITIDDSELGGGEGDSSIVETVLEIGGEFVVPALATMAVASGVWGLGALGEIVISIHNSVQQVKFQEGKIKELAGACKELWESMKAVDPNGGQRGPLEKDIKKAMSVLVKIDKFCNKLKDHGFVEKYMKTKKRENQLEALQREFDSMRSSLTTISTLKILQILRGEIAPALVGVHKKLDRISSQTQLQQATHLTSETVTTATTTKTTNSETRAKRTSKKKSRKPRVDSEPEEEAEARSARHSEYGYTEEQGNYEHDSRQQYDPRQEYDSQQQYDSRQQYDSHHNYSSEAYHQQYPNAQQGQDWYQHDGQQQHDYYDWQQQSSGGGYYEGHEQHTTVPEHYPSVSHTPSYAHHPSYSSSVQVSAARTEAHARRIEAQAHAGANAAERKAAWLRAKAEDQRQQRGAVVSNMNVNSWGSGTSVYTSVDNSMHDNRSVHYGNVVNTTTYNH